MPQVPIIMPQLGESIAEATIVNILVAPGAVVEAGQDILEVETNKAAMNVTAPCPGRIEKFLVAAKHSYPVGVVLGYIEATVEDAARFGHHTPPATNGDNRPAHTTETLTPQKTVNPTVRGLPVPANLTGASYMSPRMKARIAELGLNAADLAGLAGSGAGGRVTIQDFEKFIASLEQQKLTKASSMRVAVADAMRRSWTRPLATVGLPACLDAVLAHRKSQNPKPGPTLYALRALAVALARNSAAAGRLIGNKIVHPSSIDVGFAVEAEDGVLVPVLRHADRLPLCELVGMYNELLEQARQSSATAGGDDTTETVPPPQQPPSPPTGSASADTTPESPEPAGRTPQPRSAAPTDTTGSPHRLDDHLHSPETGQENTRDWQNDELFSEKIDSRVSDAELNQHWGNLPGSLRERILANRQPQLDYRSVLRLFHQSVLSRQRRLTRMKCSRRYGFLYQGSRYDFTTRLLVAVDVSGSMGTDDLALAFSMVNRFFRYGIESIDVVAFDTEIQGTVQSLKRARREMTVTGRGGTNFNAVIDYLDQHPDYDGVLIVTDGCAPCPRTRKARRIPLLWVFIDQGTWEASNTRLRSLGRSLYLKNRRG